MTVTFSDTRDGSCPGAPCTGNVNLDPDFVSFSDSHLNATSPLIDIAVGSAVTDDIDGDTRPQGAGPDIGADEVPGPVLEVEIDIKPGSDPNCINFNDHGVIPVAILTTDTFDASTVDAFSVQLEGSGVRVKGKSGKAGSLEDVDGDGDLDLVVQIVDDTLFVGKDTATLTGYLLPEFGGKEIGGSDEICIVP